MTVEGVVVVVGVGVGGDLSVATALKRYNSDN